MWADGQHSQMVSLLHLAEITEEGVQFQSPVDGALMMLTPERSIAIQNKLGEPHIPCTLTICQYGTIFAHLYGGP